MTSANSLTALGWNSAQAGVLVLQVLAVQRLLRTRLTPAWRCGLWFLVLARLALPVSMPSVVSLFNCIPVGKHLPASQRQSAAMGTLERRNLESAPGSALFEGHNDWHADGKSQPGLASTTGFSWTMVFWAWLGVASLFAAAVLGSSWSFWRRVRSLEPLEDSPVLRLWADCCHLLGVRRPPPVCELPGFGSPALYGCFRPRLLLPIGLVGRLSLIELRFVFLHEAAHIKRRDLFWNWLATVLQILHWFNPILWLGFAQWRADRELACDALAMEAAGDGSQRGYGETILRLLDGFVPRHSGPALAGILEDKTQLRRRLEMIGAFRPGRRSGGLVVGAMVLLAGAGLTDAQKENSPPARDAFWVRGMVVDEQGKPISAARIREAWTEGTARQTSTLTTGPDGRFTSSHGAAGRFYYTASAEGHASALAVVDGKAGPNELSIVLPREAPLKIWVTDGGGAPVPGARLRVSTPGNGGWVLDWEAVTNGQGLAEWKQRPLVPLIVAAQKTVCARVEAAPNESEKRIMLFPMLENEVR